MTSDLLKEALERPTVFKDEGPLSLEYIPQRLPHRESQLTFLAQLFRFAVEKPGSMSQRVLIMGDIGTGKTVLSQRFGLDITKVAKVRKIALHYVHVNCRENRGSLFMILKRVLARLEPEFPKRGFSSEELLQILMDMLDDRNAHLILALDELESLIRIEGSTPIYNLTRIQEERLRQPMRLSLICILREPEYLQKLDPSTLGTLQQNVIRLERYGPEELEAILADRVSLSFKDGAVPEEVVKFVAGLAASTGDARYAIELLWRAGKYADAENSRSVSVEHVRKAAGSIHPAVRGEYIAALTKHEKLLLLALARSLERSEAAYSTMGDVEQEYRATCEEYGEEARGHTQLWKYVKELSSIGIVSAKRSGEGMRGRTTLLGLHFAPAETVRKHLEAAMETLRGGGRFLR